MIEWIERDTCIPEVTQETLRKMRENFQAHPWILSTPEYMLKIDGVTPIPNHVGVMVSFTKTSTEDGIK